MIEYIRMAFEGIKLNKMRSFLTMLGIIIGIASVITIQTLGEGLKKSVNEDLAAFGTNQMYAYIDMREGWSYSDMRMDDYFTVEKMDIMKENIPEIDAIGLSAGSVGATIKNGRKKVSASIEYCNSDSGKTNNLKMVAGSFFDKKADLGGKTVCVIPLELVEKVLKISPEESLGREIQLQTQSGKLFTYNVVGVYKPAEFKSPLVSVSGGQTMLIYIPLFTGIRQYEPYSPQDFSTSWLTIKGKDDADSFKLKNDVTKYFEHHGYGKKDRTMVEIRSLDEQMDEANQIMLNITLVISIIAAISLLVGGIGVMNILLVSVTERTREIGVRKALGATNKDIRLQFIIESIILCAVGGAIGVGLGAMLGYIGSSAIGTPNLPSLDTIVVAVGFSMVIGIFFGFYPANRAAKLNPIDALRYE